MLTTTRNARLSAGGALMTLIRVGSATLGCSLALALFAGDALAGQLPVSLAGVEQLCGAGGLDGHEHGAHHAQR